MTLLPVIIPCAGALLALALNHDALRRILLVAVAIAHGLVVWANPPHAYAPGALIGVDSIGFLFLTITSFLFFVVSIYAVGYLRAENKDEREDFIAGIIFSNAPERVFTACLLFFLASMSLVCVARNLSLLWVAIECTTLASAPLIYFHRHKRSLEAVWKYLIICSVGIAIALMGLILMSYASLGSSAMHAMQLDTLMRNASQMNPLWLKASFLCILIGYGCKMGLAPMHHWLPDAHSESPSLVSALLSGALLNCAFLGIIRGHQVCIAAGLADFSGSMLILLGLASLVIAAVFIVGQGDFKRMLAYSSVEHMGLLALGIGAGGAAMTAGMLHAVNHSLTKAALFLLSGNILGLYHTKSSYDARGVLRALPATGILWVAGFFSITGTPPFGTFVSELGILQGLLAQERYGIVALTLLCLAMIFVGMSASVFRMAQGPRPRFVAGVARENVLSIGPSLILLLVVLVLGLVPPEGVWGLVREAAHAVVGVEEAIW